MLDMLDLTHFFARAFKKLFDFNFVQTFSLFKKVLRSLIRSEIKKIGTESLSNISTILLNLQWIQTQPKQTVNIDF